VNRSAEVELCFCRQGRALWAEDAPIDAGELSWLHFSIEVGRRGARMAVTVVERPGRAECG
jgi:hypothetical protein